MNTNPWIVDNFNVNYFLIGDVLFFSYIIFWYYAEVALTGCPLTFLADLSWAGVDSAPLFVSTLKNKKGKYVVICQKEDNYHMFPIIDNTIYDKNKKYFDYTITNIYKYMQ